MTKYIIRLDDASEKRDVKKWDKIEELLDSHNIKPLVGIIPNCKDKKMELYDVDEKFWDLVHIWMEKGWILALHGYNHVYTSNSGGINPVNEKSEFAGVSIELQKEKIKKGVDIFREHGLEPLVFFAPSHTFDLNTLNALSSESNIRFISDTVSSKPYNYKGFTFVPQQTGALRKIPAQIVTACFHPNTMSDKDFDRLELFISKNNESFISFPLVDSNRSLGLYDKFLRYIYFLRRK